MHLERDHVDARHVVQVVIILRGPDQIERGVEPGDLIGPCRAGTLELAGTGRGKPASRAGIAIRRRKGRHAATRRQGIADERNHA